MKFTIAMCAILTLVVFSSTNGFGQANKKTEKARENVKEAEKDLKDAKLDLKQARLDSTAEYIEFRNQALQQIDDNNKKIEELAVRKLDRKLKDQKKYDSDVAKLKEKNIKLQRKMEGSQSMLSSAWDRFKKDFNDEMKDLGKAINNLGTDNEK